MQHQDFLRKLERRISQYYLSRTEHSSQIVFLRVVFESFYTNFSHIDYCISKLSTDCDERIVNAR